jgi:zinc protease
VAETLDYLGAIFSLEVTQDATILSLRCLTHVFDEAMALMAEVVSRPAFDPGEVGRLKDERLDEIASGLDEPRIVASLRLQEAIFDGHPYGMREGGDETTVSRIDPDDLVTHHRRFYRPDAATLILVGDIAADVVADGRLEAQFGDWSGAAEATPAVPESQPADGRQLWLVDWPGPQSEIRVGGLGIARLDEEYFPALVANAILGGLFSSRLNIRLREDKGWTYGAYSKFDARKARGPYYVSTAVDAQATGGAVEEILRELGNMCSEPPSSQELELAKNSLTFSLPRTFETTTQVSRKVAQLVIYGLPDDYWETYRDHIKEVDAEGVLLVSRRCFDPDRAAVVIVGPGGRVRSDLESLGPVEERDRRGRPVEGGGD